ncbi:MAG: hypothetical protein ACLVL2_01825 [Bacteroides cellulosilyticus]
MQYRSNFSIYINVIPFLFQLMSPEYFHRRDDVDVSSLVVHGDFSYLYQDPDIFCLESVLCSRFFYTTVSIKARRLFFYV